MINSSFVLRNNVLHRTLADNPVLYICEKIIQTAANNIIFLLILVGGYGQTIDLGSAGYC